MRGGPTKNDRLKQANDSIALAFSLALVKLGGEFKVTTDDLAKVGTYKLTVRQEGDVAVFGLNPKPPSWLARVFGK